MEAKIIDRLIEVGITRGEAKILFYLFKNDSGFTKKMERDADVDLRQPEVSIATKILVERGWLKFKNINLEGKGRPKKKYSLAMSKEAIVKSIAKLFTEKIRLLENGIRAVTELMHAT